MPLGLPVNCHWIVCTPESLEMMVSIDAILSSRVAGVLGAVIVAFIVFLFFRPAPPPVDSKKKEYGQFTKEQVAQHNHRGDLWIILKDGSVSKVYDVTAYVDEHPGGDSILTNAGEDSSDEFFGPQHPPRVHDMIEDFCIGTLV